MKKNTAFVVLAILLFSLLASICFFPYMPDNMAAHWNARGEVDRYAGKIWGLFIIPFLMLCLVMFFSAVRKICPLKTGTGKSAKYYNAFIITMALFLLSVQAHIIMWNSGIKINPNVIFPGLLGILFFCAGVICAHAERNRCPGIKTPWTLRGGAVWDKTRKAAARVFKCAGIIMFVGTFFARYSVFFILIPVFLSVAGLIIYSYILNTSEIRTKKTDK
ncbi:MAG: DUF1648 domain-containing protein [Candidatus Omnitrophota bacterium]